VVGQLIFVEEQCLELQTVANRLGHRPILSLGNYLCLAWSPVEMITGSTLDETGADMNAKFTFTYKHQESLSFLVRLTRKQNAK
jgi:hypothetical protein